MAEDFQSRAPWSTEPGLKQMSEEVGVDFDRLISLLSVNRTDQEIAQEFEVPDKVIAQLRDHFERVGVHSIMGQD